MLADPLFWIFVLPGLLLGAYAQSRIKINIAKYSQIRTQDGVKAEHRAVHVIAKIAKPTVETRG